MKTSKPTPDNPIRMIAEVVMGSLDEVGKRRSTRAASGAGMGAMVGSSVGGPVGAAVGGAVGAVVAILTAEDE